MATLGAPSNEWEEGRSEAEVETLLRLNETLLALEEVQKIIDLDPLMFNLKVSIRLAPNRRKVIIIIDAFSLVQFFLNKKDLVDDFSDPDIPQAIIQLAIYDWIDRIMAQVANKISPDSRDCVKDPVLFGYLQVIYSFYQFHRYNYKPKEF